MPERPDPYAHAEFIVQMRKEKLELQILQLKGKFDRVRRHASATFERVMMQRNK
jgi:hypothetical protein